MSEAPQSLPEAPNPSDDTQVFPGAPSAPTGRQGAALKRLADVLRGTPWGTGVVLRSADDVLHQRSSGQAAAAVGCYPWAGARTIQVVRDQKVIASFTLEQVLNASPAVLVYSVKEGHGRVSD